MVTASSHSRSGMNQNLNNSEGGASSEYTVQSSREGADLQGSTQQQPVEPMSEDSSASSDDDDES